MKATFGVLGPVEVLLDGRVVDAGHARQRCVLAALLVDANRPVSAERLLDRVWGDRPPQRCRNAVSGYISRLRRLLAAAGEVTLSRERGGYRLSVDPVAVDLHRFTALLDRAGGARDAAAALALYDQAIALWRGDPFAALDTPWLDGLRVRLAAQLFTAELDRAGVALALGRESELLGRLALLTNENPLDERLAGQHMLALYRCGRQADALRRYEGLRRALAEDLGADPVPALRVLHMQILTGDPALAPALVFTTPAATVVR
jgi:DNA-binding SARP family transcriptional activator